MTPMTLQHLGGMLGVAVAAAYLSGYIAQATYLSEFGIHETDLLKGTYLITGGLFLASIGLFVFLISIPMVGRDGMIRELRERMMKAGFEQHRANVAAEFDVYLDFIFIPVFAAASCTVLLLDRTVSLWGVLVLLLTMSMLGLVAMDLNVRRQGLLSIRERRLANVLKLLGTVAVYVYLGDAMAPFLFMFMNVEVACFFSTSRDVMSSPRRLGLWLFLALVTLLQAGYFGAFIYPSVRDIFGGPSSYAVRLILNEGGYLESLRHSLRMEGQTTAPLRLIGEGESRLTVAYPFRPLQTRSLDARESSESNPSASTVISLDRKNVAAIIVPGPKRTIAWFVR